MANGKTISKGGKLLFLVSNKLVVEAPVAQWDLIIFNGIKKFFIICPILFFLQRQSNVYGQECVILNLVINGDDFFQDRDGIVVAVILLGSEGGVGSKISCIAAVVSSTGAKVQPGPDRGDRVSRVWAVDDEGHGDPEIGVSSQVIALHGNGDIAGQIGLVKCRVSSEPRVVVVVENFALGKAKKVFFLEKRLDIGLLLERVEDFFLHAVYKVEVSEIVTWLGLDDKNVFLRRSGPKNLSLQVVLDDLVAPIVDSQGRSNVGCSLHPDSETKIGFF